MQTRYFMNQEAEDAAKWRIVEQYKSAQARLAALESELKKIGDGLVQVGRAFQNVHGTTFAASGSIDAVNTLSKALVGRIDLAEITADNLTRLIEDLEATRKLKDESEERLHELGLSI